MLRSLQASQGPASALLSGRFPALPLLTAPMRGRKSRTDPPAKSKAGRIKVPPPVDPAELLVVRERYRQYGRLMKAIRSVFKQELMQQRYDETFGELGRQRQEAIVKEHQQLMAWNDAENQRLQQRREERLRKEKAEEEQQQLLRAQKEAALLEEFLKEKEGEVLQLQEEAKNFITPDNLDQRIEECLNNPRNYNFAIDKDGRIAKRSVLS
ncbi:28S ribosomal protein S26, mitochondrial [Eublepharis macularius]|uniref:Small ribosomal subunit protein mS26 n=1 Tax=Eublepharis macularius TaxID=481883 RepID=A0AA97JZ39_EUBMA|nr:28S ribosomal protein S26, mitochondrial [Eublepharis macularius]